MPTAQAQAYAMKAREDQDAPEVIAGISSPYDIKMHALIDPGSTHSYVFIEHVFDKITSLERLLYDMHVTSPLGQSVNVNRVYKKCPIVIHGTVDPLCSRASPLDGETRFLLLKKTILKNGLESPLIFVFF